MAVASEDDCAPGRAAYGSAPYPRNVPAPPKDLKLLRLAVVEFRPKLSNWRNWSVEHERIEVAPLRVWNDEDDLTRMLISASQQLDYRPSVTSDNEVVIPKKQRAAAEGNDRSRCQPHRGVAGLPTLYLLALAAGSVRGHGSRWSLVARLAKRCEARTIEAKGHGILQP